jgi:hypothetical protein
MLSSAAGLFSNLANSETSESVSADFSRRFSMIDSAAAARSPSKLEPGGSGAFSSACIPSSRGVMIAR